MTDWRCDRLNTADLIIHTQTQHHVLQHLWLWRNDPHLFLQSKPKRHASLATTLSDLYLKQKHFAYSEIAPLQRQTPWLLWFQKSNITPTNQHFTKTAQYFYSNLLTSQQRQTTWSAYVRVCVTVCVCASVCMYLIKRERLSSRLCSQYRGGTKPCACALSPQLARPTKAAFQAL